MSPEKIKVIIITHDIWKGSWRPSRSCPDSSEGKESAYNAGDLGLIPGSGRSLGGGNGNPLLYSCMKNSIDRGAWWATVHGVTRTQT